MNDLNKEWKIMKNILDSKYPLITTDVHHIYKNVIIVVLTHTVSTSIS